MNIIETSNLSHRYWRTEAVQNLNLAVPAGSVFALLGPNGAGKTTTIKMLVNLLQPTAGEARVLGVDSRRLGECERAQLGYVSENQQLPLWMTVRQLLDYCRPFYPTWDRTLEQTLLHQFELPADRKLKHLSRGMLMKAALLSSLAYRPKLLILDEPFSGLDPLMREEFVRGVLEVSALGEWTVLVSSHDIEDVERLADNVGIIERGQLRLSEKTDSLLGRFRNVELTGAPDGATAPPGALEWNRAGNLTRFVATDYTGEASERAWRGRYPGVAFRTVPLTLREIFIVLAPRGPRRNQQSRRMNLIWHIVRKDLRRLRWPLLLWLLLPLVQWTLLATTSRTAMNPTAFDGMVTMSATWAGLTWVVGLILAAWLVMEDGLVSTQAFWRTRPINGARLLAAKTLGAILMFSVLPALLMVPIWLAGGFSARELGLAVLEIALKQAIFTVAAFALACVTETAGQFLVRLIGAALLGPLALAYCAGIFDGTLGYDGNGLAETRYRLVLGVGVLTPLAMAVYQYLTRRQLRSCVLLGAGVALMFALRFGWQWDLTPWFRKFPTEAAARNQEITFTHEALAFEPVPKKLGKLSLRGTVSGVSPGAYVSFHSVRGWWSDGADFRPGAKFSKETSLPLESATRQAAGGNAPVAAPMMWTAFGFEREETLARANSDRYQIAVTADLMRGRVVGELPLRKGAVLQTGSSRIRIIDLERDEGRLTIWLQERVGWPPWSARAQDGFLLLNPAVTAEAVFLKSSAGRAVEFNAISLGQRQLMIDVPMHEVNGRIVEVPGWEETARLVQVHFTPELRFTRIMPVNLPTAPTP
ncbi:MAG: ABC transporter ATP-binding protein [Lacunisphaera sp.]